MTTGSHRLRAASLALIGVVAVYGLVGAVIVPPIAKHLVEKQGSERLGRAVTLESVSVNPYTLRTALKGLKIAEADGKASFVSFDRLDLNVSAASFYKLAPVVEELTLAGLKVRLVRDGEAHYNASDIIERLAARAKTVAASAKQKEEPARFAVQNIRVVDAAIDFDDRPVGAKHRVDQIQVAIPFISNLPIHLKDQVQPSFSASVNGSPVKVSGEALPFENTVRTHFNLDLRAVDIPRYLGYLPAGIPVKVDAGKLDARLSLRFTQAAGKDPAIDIAGTASLNDVALSGAEGTLGRFARLDTEITSLDPIHGMAKIASLRLAGASAMRDQWKVPTLEILGIEAQLPKRSVRVASVAAANGELTLTRNADGSLELPRIAVASADAPVQPAGGPAHAWEATAAKLALTGYTITLVDGAVKPAVTHRVALASLEAEGLSTDKGGSGKAEARVRIGKAGTLEAGATFALQPLIVNATVDARSIDLVPLRAYVSQFKTVALKSGAVSARGTASLQGPGDATRVTYAGTAEIANLATLDTVNKEDLLNWKSVRSSGIKLDYSAASPLRLAVAEVIVDKVYSRVVVTPDGKLNLQTLKTATPEEPQGAAPATTAKPRDVRIDRITFVDSRLNFTDHFIKPNYTADVKELQGSVTGLASDPASRASVDLKGRWDSSSPVIIAGTVNPLRGDLFADIGARGEQIELTKLSAYSARYAGYGIKEGRITLDVKYHVENGKMEGRNKIVIDRLAFGEKVEGPDATSLPVLFAVNLLKDANGRIDLELPISGSLEDPKFEFGALVGQVLATLFKKVVTSPFSLIAGAFGGNGGSKAGSSDDLAFTEFEPGASDLTPAAEAKLQTLAKLLQDRPALKLEIASRFDPDRDGAALKAKALEHRMAAAPKELSKEAREKLAAEPIEVSEEELRALASLRKEKVRAYLMAGGRLPAERLIEASATLAAPEGAKPGRVNFALK